MDEILPINPLIDNATQLANWISRKKKMQLAIRFAMVLAFVKVSFQAQTGTTGATAPAKFNLMLIGRFVRHGNEEA